MRLLPFALTLIVVLSACGGVDDVLDLGDPADLAAVRDAAEAGVDTPGQTGVGGTPVYFAKQCQWDACGGPLPDRTTVEPDDR